MQNFTIFDMVIVSITVLLGLKGLFRGFIKEVFGLVGIIGGIFVASRMSEEIGKAISPILALENEATIKLIGFILGIIGFWAIVYIAGIILSKIFQVSGLGIFDRILGFVFGAAKIFLIFSVIIYALYQVQSFKDLMNKKAAGSITYPFLIETGGYIVKLDASDFMKKVEKHMSEDENKIKEKTFAQEVKESVNELKKTTVESGTIVVDTVKKSVNDNVDKITDQIKKSVNEASAEDLKTEDLKQQASQMAKEIKEGN